MTGLPAMAIDAAFTVPPSTDFATSANGAEATRSRGASVSPSMASSRKRASLAPPPVVKTEASSAAMPETAVSPRTTE